MYGVTKLDTREAVANRIRELCKDRDLKINALANEAGMPPMTIYSILYTRSKNPGIVTLKKICDALGITLGEFFSTKEFDGLEEEIR